MPAPVLPLLLLAGAAAWAFSQSSSSSKGGGGPIPSPAASPKYDANLPQVIEATVDKELANETDPAALLLFAAALETQGFPIAAAALRARAAELHSDPVAPPPAIVPTPPPPVKPPPAPPPVVPVPIVPPPHSSPEPGPSAVFGANPIQWDPAWGLPTIAAGASSKFGGSAAAARAIQVALNHWGASVGVAASLAPLVTDGKYGPKTAQYAGAFQRWINISGGEDYVPLGMSLDAALVEDGIVGPLTVAWLDPWSPSGPI